MKLLATHASQQNETHAQEPRIPETLQPSSVLTLVLVKLCKALVRKQSDVNQNMRNVLSVCEVVKRLCSL